jgi:anti-anti-sigma regulatory factor
VRVALLGEADISTLDRREAALDDVEVNGAKSVHLDLSELDFADAATIRRLTVFAIRAKETGYDVTTCGASPTFRMAATVLGVRDQLGLL